jgi:hypothetical protein
MRVSRSEVKDDGTFKLVCFPGKSMTLVMRPIPDGYYLKSVRLGDRDLDGLEMPSSGANSGELVITLSPNTATLTGSVTDAEHEPAISGTVVLAPENRRRTDLFFAAALDQNGTYTIRNIRPGRYKVFAFDSVEMGSYEDPEWLRLFEEKGESIELKESGKPVKDLTLIATEEPRDGS